MSKEPITAEIILKNHEDAHEMHFHELDRDWIKEAMHEYAVLFAKWHREKAIEAIDNKINEFYRTGSGNWPSKVDIENTYQESEIK